MFAGLALVFAAAVWLGACSGDEASTQPWEVGVDSGNGSDTGISLDGGSCEESRPGLFCVNSCGSDAGHSAVCRGGEWRCPEGTQPMSSCPDDTCIGPPPPASCVESCGADQDQGVECRDGEWACPEGTMRQSSCPDCEVTRSSENLDGAVEIRFPGECRWSVDEVRDGVDIPYEVVVDEPVEGVVPEPNDAGRCRQPGDSGLIVAPRVHGDGHHWCRCDVGLCMEPNYQPRTLEPGTYSHEFHWEGHNWNGPSDTGMERGEHFPPGAYQITVEGSGERQRSDGDEAVPYSLEGSVDIELVE